jgi:hypothetical protein
MSESNGYGQIEFLIQGATQHVQHNGQLADASNRYAIAIKELTRKKNKTEDDFKKIEDLEWEGSLYLDHEQKVIVPGSVIEGAYFEAGKISRQGKDVRNGINSEREWRLIYKGPQTLEGLRADPNFHFKAIVRNPSTKGRLARFRPRFHIWSLRYSLKYKLSIFNRSHIIEMTRVLVDDVGLSDDRSKGGGRAIIIEIDGRKYEKVMAEMAEGR